MNQQQYNNQQWVPQPYAPYLPPTRPSHSGMAVAALVLGVVGICFGLVPITFLFAITLGVLALVFGCVARHRGMGKAGIILGVVAVAFGIWGAVIVNQVSHSIDNYSTCIDNAQTVEQMNNC